MKNKIKTITIGCLLILAGIGCQKLLPQVPEGDSILDGPVEGVDRLGVILAVNQAPPAPGEGYRRPAIDVEDCARSQEEDSDQYPAPRKRPHWDHALRVSAELLLLSRKRSIARCAT